MTVTISLLGMYQYDKTILDGFRVPEGMDRDATINNLLLETSELEFLYPDINTCKFAIGAWTDKEFRIWQKLWETVNIEYNPLYSSYREEHRSHDSKTNPIDPNYGSRFNHHGTANDPYMTGAIDPEIGKLINDPDAPYGRDPTTNKPLSKDEYDERYVQENKNWDRYPGNDGATPGTIIRYYDINAAIRDYGPHLDRIGDPKGQYLSTYVDGRPATFEERALPISSLEKEYHKYQFSGALPKGWTIEISEIAPAFGRSGGATQIRVFDQANSVVSVSEMLIQGILL